MDNARKQSELLCLVVGEVPNSGYTLRFTQEHVCLRISTKPVDIPEDSPQMPQNSRSRNFVIVTTMCALVYGGPPQASRRGSLLIGGGKIRN